jgi:hypothetical protein
MNPNPEHLLSPPLELSYRVRVDPVLQLVRIDLGDRPDLAAQAWELRPAILYMYGAQHLRIYTRGHLRHQCPCSAGLTEAALEHRMLVAFDPRNRRLIGDVSCPDLASHTWTYYRGLLRENWAATRMTLTVRGEPFLDLPIDPDSPIIPTDRIPSVQL